MKKLALVMWLVTCLSAPAHAFTGVSGTTEELEFLAQTKITGADQQNLSVCYVTRSFRVFGFALTNDITRFALSADNCNTELRPFSDSQMIRAQSLDLITAHVPSVARNNMDRNLKKYGLLLAVSLGMIAVIWRRMKSIMGYDPDGPLRKRAAQRVASVMCHAAKCNGDVSSAQIAMIARAAHRLTQREFPLSDITRLTNKIDPALETQDYIAFGKGLRDHEKDVMMHAVLLVMMADRRMLPVEYEFVSRLANGLGIPGNDFRRVLKTAIDDLNT